MSATARIFDVKRFAVHDGPGIRTTFFLMGCPLRCLWCQNPESQRDECVITFTRMKCIGCGACRRACGKLDGQLQLPRGQCALCGACVEACPSGARKFGSREYTPQEVLDAVLPEKVFFDASGGGVTFSGGECLLHPEFLAESLRLLKEHGIHTALDTCGAVPSRSVLMTAPYTDLYLYDLKKMDPVLHQAYTGTDNRQILENLELLCGRGASIIIRVPLIPGYTDSPEDIHQVGAYLRDVLHNRILRCELLPYNKLAGSKYGNKTIWSDYTLGEYPLPDAEPQDHAYLLSLSEILAGYGVPVYTESL